MTGTDSRITLVNIKLLMNASKNLNKAVYFKYTLITCLTLKLIVKHKITKNQQKTIEMLLN